MNKEYDRFMHTVEHILNQTIARIFGCGRAFSAHIEKKKSKCDYRMERAPTAAEIAGVETAVNEIIRSNLPVTEEFMDRREAERLFNLKRLPDDAGETLRIVRVGGYDACPCIGPHVSRTGEIGAFRIISTTFKEGVSRVRFRLSPTGVDGVDDPCDA
ncbi:MAG: hypothetical protein JW884_03380 [Deltaproteobacteria bacterium]|nr:hypothetical protein [Deltaproteobacteria bacterium]